MTEAEYIKAGEKLGRLTDIILAVLFAIIMGMLSSTAG